MLKFCWTTVITVAFLTLAFANAALASAIVPLFCVLVSGPLAMKWCERRYARYRQGRGGHWVH